MKYEQTSLTKLVWSAFYNSSLFDVALLLFTGSMIGLTIIWR